MVLEISARKYASQRVWIMSKKEDLPELLRPIMTLNEENQGIVHSSTKHL